MIGPPPELDQLAADLERDTGTAPTVEPFPGVARRWRLTMRSPRVAMTLVVRPAKRGRYTWLDSKLVVDGQPREIADNYRDFVRIFNDPDETPPLADIPEPLPPCDPDAPLPVLVAQFWRRLTDAFDPDLLTLGHAGNRWVIDIVTDHAFMRLSFVRQKPGKPAGAPKILLIVDGRDRSREVADNIAVATALFTEHAGPGPTNPVSVGATSGEHGYGSVGVRRHSVIRN